MKRLWPGKNRSATAIQCFPWRNGLVNAVVGSRKIYKARISVRGIDISTQLQVLRAKTLLSSLDSWPFQVIRLALEGMPQVLRCALEYDAGTTLPDCSPPLTFRHKLPREGQVT